jgi:hypothetical protein
VFVGFLLLLAAAARAEEMEPTPPLLAMGPEASPRMAMPAEPLKSVVPETMVEPAAGHTRAGRIGVLFGLVGAPQTFGVEGFAKVHDIVGVGVGFGMLPGALGGVLMNAAGVNGGKLDSSAFEGEARVFPFRGSFWLGGALGRMSLSASGNGAGSPVTVDVTTLYASPRLGWLAVWQSGLSLGLDLGVQFPIGPDVKVTTSSPGGSNIESVARSLAVLPLPTATVRLGFLL